MTRAVAEVDRLADVLVDVSHRIWDHPELCFEEHHAHDLLCDVLEAQGLTPTRHAYGLDTAFVAEAGTTGPADRRVLRVRRAARHRPRLRPQRDRRRRARRRDLAAARLADELGGRVRILGCPAEEGGGGKVFMIRAGAFDGVDAAMMVHPADHDLPTMTTLAIHGLEVALPRARRPTRRPHPTWAATPSTPRCSATSTSRRCASTSRPTSGCTASSPRRGRSRTSFPAPPRRAGTCAPAPSSASRELKERVVQCLAAGADGGRVHHGAAVGRPARTPTCVTTPSCSSATGRHAEPLGRPFPDPADAARGRGQHRHGRRQPRRAQHPPDAGRGAARGVDPHPRVRRPRPRRARGTGPCSTAPGPWRRPCSTAGPTRCGSIPGGPADRT